MYEVVDFPRSLLVNGRLASEVFEQIVKLVLPVDVLGFAQSGEGCGFAVRLKSGGGPRHQVGRETRCRARSAPSIIDSGSFEMVILFLEQLFPLDR